MTNFARSLPQNAINKPSKDKEKISSNIEAQHKKWAKHLRNIQGNSRRSRRSFLSRIDEYSNLQVAIIGSIATSAVVGITISILVMLGL